jgi:hypothetical protein
VRMSMLAVVSKWLSSPKDEWFYEKEILWPGQVSSDSIFVWGRGSARSFSFSRWHWWAAWAL